MTIIGLDDLAFLTPRFGSTRLATRVPDVKEVLTDRMLVEQLVLDSSPPSLRVLYGEL